MMRIVVIGSLNMDLSVKVSRLPAPGETIGGGNLQVSPGGKGANQAVACAKLGARVVMSGAVGEDSFGAEILQGLQAAGIDVSKIEQLSETSTGTAVIVVDESGENSIVLSAGANGAFTKDKVEKLRPVISAADFLLLQLEIPIETVVEIIDVAHELNVPVLLNPAPAVPLPDSIFPKITYLVPNETEATLLSGVKVKDSDSAKQASDILRQKGVNTVIITMGALGAYVNSPKFQGLVPTIKIEPIDTTAAGDSFIGAFAFATTNHYPIEEVVRFACCAGALTATKSGAQISLPTLAEVSHVFTKGGK